MQSVWQIALNLSETFWEFRHEARISIEDAVFVHQMVGKDCVAGL